MTITRTTIYRCNTCWDLYRIQRDAEECCPPQAVEHWDCGREICLHILAGNVHRTQADAEQCADAALTKLAVARDRMLGRLPCPHGRKPEALCHECVKEFAAAITQGSRATGEVGQ